MENIVDDKSVVDSSYFLQRISRFEQEYGIDSVDFMTQYRKDREQFDSKTVDFSHWAFLCMNFLE